MRALGIEPDSYALIAAMLDEFVRVAPEVAPGASCVIWDDVSYWVDLPDKSITPTMFTAECVCDRPFYVGVGYYPWGVDVGELHLWDEAPKGRYRSRETFEFPNQDQNVDSVMKVVIDLVAKNILDPSAP